MKKVYYDEVRPLGEELRLIYKDDPNNHDKIYETILIYTLHKGGLTEDGIPEIQFDQIFNAFIDSMNAMGQIVEEQQIKNIAKS